MKNMARRFSVACLGLSLVYTPWRLGAVEPLRLAPFGGTPTPPEIAISNGTAFFAASSAAAIDHQATFHFDADADGANEATARSDDPTTPASGDPTSFTFAQNFFTVPPCRAHDTRTTTP